MKKVQLEFTSNFEGIFGFKAPSVMYVEQSREEPYPPRFLLEIHAYARFFLPILGQKCQTCRNGFSKKSWNMLFFVFPTLFLYKILTGNVLSQKEYLIFLASCLIICWVFSIGVILLFNDLRAHMLQSVET